MIKIKENQKINFSPRTFLRTMASFFASNTCTFSRSNYMAESSQDGLKIGFAGKGGVGKTLLASTIARLAARKEIFENVLAIDNDPSLNLGMSLGLEDDEIGPPISEMSDLIKERTGATPGSGLAFKLNPYVEDIPDEYTVNAPDGVRLLVLGTIQDPGSGCLCSANALVRELLYHLIVQRNELVILDFEAGVESSLGRATSKGLDVLFIIVEPGQKSIKVGQHMAELATKLGIKNVFSILNKMMDEEQQTILEEPLERAGAPVFGTVPYSRAILEADLKGIPVLDSSPEDAAVKSMNAILEKILKEFYPSCERKPAPLV
ncbi:hypothetical protein GF325_15460 [Candidatus Bathyarchaeota archaeon]|nr:hypothetical protein [Candidatus Bathyarchaeota archaeon]